MINEIKASIVEDLKHKREKLTASSLKTYSSILYNVFKRLKKEDEAFDVKFYEKENKRIMDELKTETPAKRKTILSALYIITGLDTYKTLMLSDCSKVNQEYKQQKMTAKESDNWVTMDDVRAKYEQYLGTVVGMLSHKVMFNDRVMIDFLILALMSGVSGIPPRRSLDYAEMKIRHYNKETDNYYENGKFVFNQYKTAKVYGRVVVDVKRMAPQLNTIIKKWIALNPTDYLLYSSNHKALSNVQLSQYNNRIWGGKKVSTDIYRHTYITDFYKGQTPTYLQMEDLAKFMGHSISTALQYIKNDAPADA